MLIGCCRAIDQAADVAAAGFDYLEAGLVSLVPDADDEAFAPVLAQYQASPLPVLAFNLFLPRDLRIVGPEVDEARMKLCTQRALQRAQQIGAKIAVFGSGGARNVPDDFPREKAVAQIVHFLDVVADAADQTDVVIAIEPLNRKESNIINSVAEGADFARQVNRPKIQVLADFYHMDEDDEPLSHLVEYKDWLAHIHVADTGRLAPGTGQYPYQEFADGLRAAGYEGLVSIECRWEDFAAEAPAAVEFLRKALPS
jgi:sugar phosphate isomerase/epimerase